MNKIFIIAKKELRMFFDSLMAYIMLISFLGFSGFFTWIYGADIFLTGQASLQTFFSIAFWTLFFFIPALTMRMVAEEQKSGTMELLMTKPVNLWQIVMGKYFAVLTLVIISLVLTLPYYLTIHSIGKIDHGAVLCGYLGLIFMSSVYIAIGLFASSLSQNQIVGFLSALFIGIFFHIIFDSLSTNLKGLTGQVVVWFSMPAHFGSISRGVVDTKDLLFFGSLTYLGLFLTREQLAKH